MDPLSEFDFPGALRGVAYPVITVVRIKDQLETIVCADIA
jgi:hypothetical protein